MEEPVDLIRGYSRTALTVSRRAHRDEETDGRRQIVTNIVTPAAIADIANRLKSKTTISTEDLRILKNSILEDSHHIEVVLNTHSAVRGLVRELTGQDAHRRSEATGCLCNLSLGDERACSALAKAAGPYLLTALQSLHNDLAVTCAWTLGNLSGGGSKPTELLTSQGAAAALITAMTSRPDDVSDAAAEALIHFVYQTGDDLRQDYVSQILEAVSKRRFTETSLHLLSTLSCHEHFNQLMQEELLQKLLEHSMKSLEDSNNLEFMYTIRTLANINMNDQIYSIFVTCFSKRVDVLKKLLASDDDRAKSLFWFLGNLFNYNCDNEFFNVLLS